MRLRTRKQYLRMGNHTVKFTGCWIIADIRVTNGSFSRLGITVTKRYGQSVQRNRFKRLVREAFRLSYSRLSPAIDIVVRPRTYALKASMRDIQKELLHFIEQVHGIKDNPKHDLSP